MTKEEGAIGGACADMYRLLEGSTVFSSYRRLEMGTKRTTFKL